eukprot:c6787_g1_i2.p1 GENE.c6787_g1_i2~~c6787_g1_i2.p1  ORF type:complete len:108 (+),score=17.99 c6787_g1_i2:66-389(+)
MSFESESESESDLGKRSPPAEGKATVCLTKNCSDLQFPPFPPFPPFHIHITISSVICSRISVHTARTHIRYHVKTKEDHWGVPHTQFISFLSCECLLLSAVVVGWNP